MKTFVVIEKASKVRITGSWADCIKYCKIKKDKEEVISLRVARVRAGSIDAKVVVEITKNLLRFLEPSETYSVRLKGLKKSFSHG